jgi:hydroxypyruvate isomerase
MPKFCANLSFLFQELPSLPARIEAAGALGFSGVEYASPYADDVGALRASLQRSGMKQVLFNLPAGDMAAGDRGFAVDPARTGEFRKGVADALRIAGELGCSRINCLAGRRVPGVDQPTMQSTLVNNLQYAADAFASSGITLMLEPLNRIDTPDFTVGTMAEALELLALVGRPNFKVQYDCYHAQRSEGNLLATLRTHLASIGHIQIADSPDRHEPGTGELAYGRILRAIDDLGYDGWVGIEYKPSTPVTADSFGWIERYGFAFGALAAK